MICRGFGRVGRLGLLGPGTLTADATATATTVGAAAPQHRRDDLIAGLQQLADLRDRGVLNDAEFQSAKERLINA